MRISNSEAGASASRRMEAPSIGRSMEGSNASPMSLNAYFTRFLRSRWSASFPVSLFRSPMCGKPVVITAVRQTGDFRRQPLDRRKTPSLTPIDDYRVFPVILPGTAFNAGKPHTDDRPFETRTSAAVAKLRTSATLPIRI